VELEKKLKKSNFNLEDYFNDTPPDGTQQIETSKSTLNDFYKKEIKSKKKQKDDIFMIFYINIDGLTKKQADMLLKQYMSHLKLKVKTYNINTILLPVTNQPTKIEFFNPKLINGDIIKSFKNLVDTLDDDKYKEIMNKLKC